VEEKEKMRSGVMIKSKRPRIEPERKVFSRYDREATR